MNVSAVPRSSNIKDGPTKFEHRQVCSKILCGEKDPLCNLIAATWPENARPAEVAGRPAKSRLGEACKRAIFGGSVISSNPVSLALSEKGGISEWAIRSEVRSPG